MYIKRIATLIIGICLFCIRLFSSTIVNTPTVSGTWMLSNSPYLIDNNITIPAGANLTIEPGVNILFRGYYKLEVLGSIIAVGDSTHIIEFKPIAGVDIWNRILMSGIDSSSFAYCSFAYGGADVVLPNPEPTGNGGAITAPNGTNISITHCSFQFCYASCGGAIFGNSLTISDCIFDGNVAVWGGGAICGAGNNIINCEFIGNAATGGEETWGGAIRGSVNIENSIFSNNYADHGGALYGSGKIKNCSFSDNEARYWGKGIITTDHTLVVEHSVIKNNIGVGIFDYFGSLSLLNCQIYNNSGGGIMSWGGCRVDKSLISNNGGIGISSTGGYSVLSNSVICNNTNNITHDESLWGGGVSIRSGSIDNCTIANNHSALYGGGLFIAGYMECDVGTQITNTILYGNTATAGSQIGCVMTEGEPVFLNCLVEGGFSGIFIHPWGNPVLHEYNYIDCFDTNPLFINPSLGAGTQYIGYDKNWGIHYNSPCIDAGSPLSQPDADGTMSDVGAIPYLHKTDFIPNVMFATVGTTIAFDNVSMGHDTPVSQFEWDVNYDGFIDYNSCNAVHTYNNPGVYTVMLRQTTGNLVDETVCQNLIIIQDEQLLPPQNLVIAHNTDNSFTLNWSPVTFISNSEHINVPYYFVYSSSNPNGRYAYIGHTINGITTFYDQSSVGVSNRFYRVIGYNGSEDEFRLLLKIIQNPSFEFDIDSIELK